MNPHSLILAINLPEGWGLAALAIVALLVVVFLFGMVWASRYTKVGPNEVLVVSGRRHMYREADGTATPRGFRIVKGGGTFVMPVVEKVDILSLELLTIDVQTPEVYTSKGVPVKVDGVAQIKVKGDDVSIATAAEQFLSKGTDEIKNIAMQTLEGHLRAILGTMTVEEIYQNRDAFASKVQEVAAGDMANMGLGIVSFTIRDIRDSQGYLDALGKPRIAQVKRDAQIAQAEADRDAMIKSSQATQAGQEAKFVADTKIAEAQRDYQIERRAVSGGGEPEEGRGGPRLRLAEIQDRPAREGRGSAGQIIEKQKQIELQQQEILRKQRELEANVQKPADAERYRVETLANATKFQLETEAAGAAAAAKAKGFASAEVAKATGIAEAEANKARGLAEAAIIEAQGKATAEAMRHEGRVVQAIQRGRGHRDDRARCCRRSPAKSASRSRRPRRWSSSTAATAPAAARASSPATSPQIIGQLPPVLESLTGVRFEKLLEQVPALRQVVETEASKAEPKRK